MAERATFIDKTCTGMAFMLDQDGVASVIIENADGAKYGDEEDTNQYFLFATGLMATRGHAILRESRPFDALKADVSADSKRAGIWSFTTEEDAHSAFIGVTARKTPGTAYLFRVTREQVADAA